MAQPLAPSPMIMEPMPPPPQEVPQGRAPGPFLRAGDLRLGIAWNASLPIGSVHDFTSPASAIGFELQFRYWVLPNLSLGVSSDWQTLNDTRPRTTYPIEDGALTATAYNSVQTGAARAIVHYYFLDDGPVLPYAGANIGIGWSTFQTQAADIAFYDDQTSVLLGAELGALIRAGDRGPTFLLGIRYTALPAMEFMNVTDVQSLALQLGLLLP
jgi:opacity protein-like surface antigen